MSSKKKISKLIFRKLKISDYKEFQKLFLSSFNRNISFNFYKWRYFSNKISFCYGAFASSKLIANVGCVYNKLNNKKKEKFFSRHSSMVHKNYRGIGIFSELLQKAKIEISKRAYLVVMWPNKNNFASFGLKKEQIIKKRYYIYKTSASLSSIKNKYYKINKLISFKKFLVNKNHFFYKNFSYFKNRYLLYKKNDYLIDYFNNKKLKSFFIIKRQRDKNRINYIILEHFGSKKIYLNHLTHLVKNQNNLVFLSKKRINKSNFKLITLMNFHIGLLKNLNLKAKNNLKSKEIFLGDTDMFITIS